MADSEDIRTACHQAFVESARRGEPGVSPFELQRQASDLLCSAVIGAELRAALNILIEEGVALRVGRMLYALADRGPRPGPV